MNIFALNPSRKLLNDNFIEKLKNFGEVTYNHEKLPVLEIEGITDPTTDKILMISPLYVDWKLDNQTLDAIPNLKAIFLTSTSYSWVDIAYLASKNIPVFNGGTYSTNAVAEGAIFLAMAIARKVPLIIQNDWTMDYVNHLGTEIAGKKAGIVGLGNIGSRIGELAKGIGMDVTYWSRKTRDDRFTYVELDKLFAESDVVFITLATSDETKSLITDDMLRSMKQSTIFVSIAHEVYNYNLVNQLVREGKIYGFGNEEKEDKTNTANGNIWSGVPFVWYTQESLDRNAEVLLSRMKEFREGDLGKRVE